MNYRDELERASFAVRDKVGKVLSSGSEIISLRDRANYFRGAENRDVAATADSIVAKASGLLTNYKGIEADAAAAGMAGNNLLAQMETDPVWKSILSGDMSNFGWATMSAAKDKIGQAVNVIAKLAGVARRADAHLEDVNQLRRDQASLEQFAQGKGIRAALASTGGGLLSALGSLKWLGIGAVALAAVIYLPKPRRGDA